MYGIIRFHWNETDLGKLLLYEFIHKALKDYYYYYYLLYEEMQNDVNVHVLLAAFGAPIHMLTPNKTNWKYETECKM